MTSDIEELGFETFDDLTKAIRAALPAGMLFTNSSQSESMYFECPLLKELGADVRFSDHRDCNPNDNGRVHYGVDDLVKLGGVEAIVAFLIELAAKLEKSRQRVIDFTLEACEKNRYDDKMEYGLRDAWENCGLDRDEKSEFLSAIVNG